jgi:hypothetical protein
MKHLKPFFCDRLVVETRTPDVITYKEVRFNEKRSDGKPLSVDTIRKELSLLGQIFAYAD